MTTLLIAEHDNKILADANKKAMENNMSFANKRTGMILNKNDNKLKNVNKSINNDYN